jgi:hypothetical protein
MESTLALSAFFLLLMIQKAFYQTASSPRFNLLHVCKGDLLKQTPALLEFEQKSHAAKLEHHLYKQGLTDFNKMTNLSLKQRQELKTKCVVDPPRIAVSRVVIDGLGISSIPRWNEEMVARIG